MSDIFQNTINKIKKIQELSYLEIGIGPTEWGNNIDFFKVNATNKFAVDIKNPLANFVGSSDNFFNINKQTFDIIFIDADHELNQVIKDFNNSIKFINENGLIFIHDLFPVDKAGTSFEASGDSYSILKYLYDNNYNFFFTRTDCGLTCVKSFHPIINKNVKRITYEELCSIDFKDKQLSEESFIDNVIKNFK